MSRYIDADALKAYYVDLSTEKDIGYGDMERMITVNINHIIKTIDDAPAIEPTEEFEWCTDCKEYDQEKHCCHRWTKVIRKTIAEIEEEYKPKRGEWIRTERMGTFKLYDCSACGIHIEAPWNFCPNCGARMKGADDE